MTPMMHIALTTRTTQRREAALTGSWCLQGQAYIDSHVSPATKFENLEVGH